MNYLFANITWNRYNWEKIDQNKNAGAQYAREHPGHECLNFDFNENKIDDEKYVYGYFEPGGKNPVKLDNTNILLFVSKNLENSKSYIVGIYYLTEYFKSHIIKKHEGFDEKEYNINLKADKRYSLRFPIPLEIYNYRTKKGFRYFEYIINPNIVQEIILDEIKEIEKNKNKIDCNNDLLKLNNIIKLLNQVNDYEKINLKEQEEIEKEINEISNKEIIKYLNEVKETDSQTVIISSKTYKRNNKTTSFLKKYRDFKCQICNTYILKKDGSRYIEAAHIKRKADKGCETPDNLLILCPNHHKELDVGKIEFLNNGLEFIEFSLNGKYYKFNKTIK